jgi:dipeptide/tripeptide permease
MGYKTIKPLIFIFGMLTLFIFIISFTVFYTTENFSSSCGCTLPPWVVVVSMSSLGLFVGLATYYIIMTYYLEKEKKFKKNVIRFLDFLKEEDKNVLSKIIEADGEINQSSLSKKLGFDKVKTSRIISILESKEIIKKEKKGMTNRIILKDEIRELFI